jgi:uncharacterized protein (TIGR02246 family)
LTDEEQIRDVIRAWHVATRVGDARAVLNLMTDDVVFLVAGRPPMYQAEFEALTHVPPGSSAPLFESTYDVEEVQVVGDLAVTRTQLTVTVTPPGASHAIVRAGFTLSVFRRVAGQWLLARDANLLTIVPQVPA